MAWIKAQPTHRLRQRGSGCAISLPGRVPLWQALRDVAKMPMRTAADLAEFVPFDRYRYADSEDFMQTTNYRVEGKIFEVLQGCGLASVSSKQGAIYTVDRHTPGIDFDNLHNDQLIRCVVDLDSKRVVRAALI